MSSYRFLTAAALAGLVSFASAGASGDGKTTRFWDCCKPSCAWPGKSPAISTPVQTCNINDQPLNNPNEDSGCAGGGSYMCSDQTPFAIDDQLAYGFAAVNIAGGTEAAWCCACYQLTFTSTAIAGKTMIVQALNTGGDLGNNQFDLAIPGGGVGIFNGCTAEWKAPSGGWGQVYGGLTTNSCASLPAALQPGCNFRFGWMMGADNPTVQFEQVACPAELTAKSGCKRSDDTTEPAPSGGAGAAPPASSAAAPPPASSAVAPPPKSSAAAPPPASSSTPAPAAPPPATTAAAPPPASTPTCIPPPASSSSPPATNGPNGVSAIFDQCAGLLWNGPTTCTEGLTCQYQNPWYSQCLTP